MKIQKEVKNILQAYKQGHLSLEETVFHLTKEAGYETLNSPRYTGEDRTIVQGVSDAAKEV